MNHYKITVNNQTYDVLVREFLPDRAQLDINGKRYLVDRSTLPAGSLQPMPGYGIQATVPVPGFNPNGPNQPAFSATGSATAVKETVTAPLPGSVLEILVKEGACVGAGDVLLKMEAMKMETDICTQTAGTIHTIKVNVGDAVNQDQVLMEIK